jgi:hypothetical protein
LAALVLRRSGCPWSPFDQFSQDDLDFVGGEKSESGAGDCQVPANWPRVYVSLSAQFHVAGTVM